ncbi:hypothetical protein [Burkholderia diffusa]|uniref:hypothetical protein n=1 Tax=Burkholderia diffusa TaxID=488732 RepID=UPI00075F5CA0|nr:hypothetical protein [Burkholderia diffusa]KVH48410.1 hypothetical protein WJ39_13950 [Burkholderia diffusa]
MDIVLLQSAEPVDAMMLGVAFGFSHFGLFVAAIAVPQSTTSRSAVAVLCDVDSDDLAIARVLRQVEPQV